MSSFAVFYIIAAILMFTQCQEVQEMERTEPHKYTIKNCNKLEINASDRNSTLQARERFVVLVPEPGYEFVPRAVPVKRCNGQCQAHYSPMPKDTRMKLFTVRLKLKGEENTLNCTSVEVLEHTKCRCGCILKAESCTDKQWWDEANCDCKCKVSKSDCESKMGMVWNGKDCSCSRCSGLCHSGRIWNEEKCECKCKPNETLKAACRAMPGMSWNDEDCSCRMTPKNVG